MHGHGGDKEPGVRASLLDLQGLPLARDPRADGRGGSSDLSLIACNSTGSLVIC